MSKLKFAYKFINKPVLRNRKPEETGFKPGLNNPICQCQFKIIHYI